MRYIDGLESFPSRCPICNAKPSSALGLTHAAGEYKLKEYQGSMQIYVNDKATEIAEGLTLQTWLEGQG
ncbi:MAG: hypothetical protein K2K51_06055, partial [Bacteroidales bacterium]|nr:hypothetical protein [Bacteroidales bacterium]